MREEFIYLISGLILLIAAFLFAAAPADPFTQGLEELAAGNPAAAINSFRRVRTDHPLIEYVWLYRAQAYLQRNDPAQAIAVLANVNIPFEAALLRGKAHLLQGNLSLATTNAQEALRTALLREEQEVALFLLLDIAERADDHLQQVKTILQLLDIIYIRFIGYGGRVLHTHLAAAVAFLDPADNRERQALLDYGLHLVRDDPITAHRVLSDILPFLTGENMYKVLFQLAFIEMTHLRDYRSAQQRFNDLISVGPQTMVVRSRYFTAHNFLNLGQRQEAKRLFRQIITTGDRDWAPLSLYWLFRLYLGRNVIDAWELLRGAQRDFTPSAHYHRSLFRLFFHHLAAGNYTESLPVIKLLLSLPLGHHDHPRALFWRHRLGEILGDTAERYLQRLGLLYPLSYYSLIARERGYLSGPLFIPDRQPTIDALLTEASGRLKADNEAQEKLSRLILLINYRIWRPSLRYLVSLAPVLGDYLYLQLKSHLYEVKGELRLAISYATILAEMLPDPIITRSLLTRIYPRHYQSIVQQAAAQFNTEEALIFAIIRRESAFETIALSRSDAHGLMQIIPTTANDIARRLALDDFELVDLFDPQTNIIMGTSYIIRQLTRFGDLRLAIAAYHGGSGNLRRWLDALPNDDIDLFIELIPRESTRLYVKAVYQALLIYRAIYF
jgi:soluble lytic murein transglycosylase-like protein